MTKVEKMCQMYSLVAMCEGMKAENVQREMRGESLAYSEIDFFRISTELEKLANVKEFEPSVNYNFRGLNA